VRTRSVMTAIAVCLAVVALPFTAFAGPSVSGSGQHEPAFVDLPPDGSDSHSAVHETLENSVMLSFPLFGGDFQGTGTIRYQHTVTFFNEPDPCTGTVFTTILIEYKGDFVAATREFTGTVEAVSQESTQPPECPENQYTYKIEEGEKFFLAQLDPSSGRITEQEGLLFFTVEVDPADVAPLLDDGGPGDDDGPGDGRLDLPEAIEIVGGGTGPVPPGLTPGDVVVVPRPGGGSEIIIPFEDPWPGGLGDPPVDDFLIGIQFPGFSGGIGIIEGRPVPIGGIIDLPEQPFLRPDGTVVIPVPFEPEEIEGGGISIFGPGFEEHGTIERTGQPGGGESGEPIVEVLERAQRGESTPGGSTTDTTAGSTATTTASGGESGIGGIPPWLIGLVVIGIGGIGGWWFLAGRRRDPCQERYDQWQEMERQCAEARAGLANARRELEESGDAGTWQSSVDEWQGMVDDFCRRAEEAKASYEECVEERDRPAPEPTPVAEQPPLEPAPPFVPGPAEGEEPPAEEAAPPVETPPPPVRTQERGCNESDPPREKNKRTLKLTIPSAFQPVLIGGDFHQAETDSLGLVEEFRQVEVVSYAVAKALLLAPGAASAEEFQVPGVDAGVVAGGVKFAADYTRVLFAGAAAIIEKWMDHYGDMPDNEVAITWKRIPYTLTCVEIWVCRDGRWVHDRNRFTTERTGGGQSVRTRLESGMSHDQAMQHINTYGAKFKAELDKAMEQYDAFVKGCAGK